MSARDRDSEREGDKEILFTNILATYGSKYKCTSADYIQDILSVSV